ncbi:MAG: CaiB/BaiF CoA transferase family protein [Candidatus Hodarchaeota archaeon]
MIKMALERLTVIDFANILAAPLVGSFMADFGANVIKVEMPKIGDVMRGTQFFPKGRSPHWLHIGRNKKSITLNLKTKEGQEIAKKLVAKADVVVFNFRPGVLEKWNLDADTLHQINPNLIIILVSGYGQTGPYSNKGAFDRTISAFAGLTYKSGYPDRPPVRSGYALVDFMSGYLGAFAVMMALYNRDVNHSGGEVIDLSLTEAAFKAAGGELVQYAQLGTIPERVGNRFKNFVPAENFETKDGRYICINAAPDNLWAKLAKTMKREDLLSDKRFKKPMRRIRNQDELYEIIGNWVKNYTAREVIKILDRNDVPADIVNNIDDLAVDPHMIQREAIVKFKDPEYGDVLVPGIVPKLKNFPGKIKFLGGNLGEYNQDVYKNFLGLSKEEIKELEEKEVI